MHDLCINTQFKHFYTFFLGKDSSSQRSLKYLPKLKQSMSCVSTVLYIQGGLKGCNLSKFIAM